MIPPAQDYASSRASFLDLVRAAGSVVESHLHPEQGPAGEELACDVARFGAPPGDAATVVLISSGLHGVEGHAGWGLQRLLVESGRLATLKPSVAVVLVHAVNPFGFAWSRRVDHDNIDVNRNFVDVDHLPANPRYAEVDSALNPTADQFDPDDLSFLAELQELVDLAGMLEAFRVISGGQYSHPQGVQFGGQHESWSRRTLERIWADHLPGAVRAVALDIHTGLGPTGRLTVFQTANEDEPAAELGRSWFPDYLYRADRDEEQATDTGLMGPGFDSWVAASEDLVADTAAFVIEFGTHDPIQGVTVFRADNWLHHHGDPRSDLGVEIRRRMRDFFFVEDEEWRRVVAEQGMAAITAALDGVGRVTSPEVHGLCDERFAAVRQVFEGNFANGLEVGASVAVTVDGEFVVDLWGGVADVDTGRPWERDTIVNVWSSTKTMVALVALELADRGVLDLHAPVATYWPEFAAAGKEGIEVRHVLGHTAGLSGWRDPMTVDGLYDLPTANSLLAAQAPLWEPGTASGYHAITEGHLMGEIVRRVTGVSFGEYFRTTFAEPLGADFQIGVGATDDARVATIVPPSFPLGGGVDLEVGSIPHMTLCNPVVHATISATEAFRRAELPAANGHGNARSMARVQSIVSNGGVLDGHRFLSEVGIEALFEEQACGVDLVQAVPLRLGVGYGINGPELPVSPNPRACYWGGWGGSIVLNDLDANVTFAYAMNRMGEGSTVDFRGVGLALAMHTVLMA